MKLEKKERREFINKITEIKKEMARPSLKKLSKYSQKMIKKEMTDLIEKYLNPQ